jgi:hypothetical protein
MYHYRYAISYESDTQPVETVRGEFEAPRMPVACHRAGNLARDSWPPKRGFRSVVIVIERLEAEVADDAVPEAHVIDAVIE